MAALPYSLLGLSRVSRPQQRTTSAVVLLNYSDFKDLGWHRYVSSALACLEPPWDAFQNVKWVAEELSLVLEDLKGVCRQKLLETPSRSENNEDHPDEQKKLLVLFLCTVVTGIASVWDQIEELFDSSSSISLSQASPAVNSTTSVLPLKEENFDQNLYGNVDILDNTEQLDYQSSKRRISKDSSNWNETGIESRVLGCFSVIIECLSLLTASPSLAALVCERSNNGLLFFDCLAINDHHVRYDTLQLIQRLLCNGRLYRHHGVDLDELENIKQENEREFRKSKSGGNEENIVSGINIEQQSLGFGEGGAVEQAVISAPHSIGTLMELLEHEDSADFIRNECINVLLVLLERSEELRRITTFQNLPEQLMKIILNDIMDDTSPHIDSDISSVCYDCLRCIKYLFKSQQAQKYFHQTGLIYRLIEVLSLLLTGSAVLPNASSSLIDLSDNRSQGIAKSPNDFLLQKGHIIPRGLSLLLSILKEFVMGSDWLEFDEGTLSNQTVPAKNISDHQTAKEFENRRKYLRTPGMERLILCAVETGVRWLSFGVRKSERPSKALAQLRSSHFIESGEAIPVEHIFISTSQKVFQNSLDLLLLGFYNVADSEDISLLINESCITLTALQTQFPSIEISQPMYPANSTAQSLPSAFQEIRLLGPVHQLARLIFTTELPLAARLWIVEVLEALISPSSTLQEMLIATLTPGPMDFASEQLTVGLPVGIVIVKAFQFLREYIDGLDIMLQQVASESSTTRSTKFSSPTITNNYRGMFGDEQQQQVVDINFWIASGILSALFFHNATSMELGISIPVSLPNENCPSESLSDLIISVFGKLSYSLSTLLDHLRQPVEQEQASSSFCSPLKHLLLSMVAILQLLCIWMKGSPPCLERCMNDLTFVPSLLNLVCIGDNITQKSAIIEFDEWECWKVMIQGLSASLLARVIETAHQTKSLTVSALLSAIQNRFSLDRFMKKITSMIKSSIFRQTLKHPFLLLVSALDNKEGIFDVRQLSRYIISQRQLSLGDSFSLTSPSFRVFQPTLCKELHDSHNGLQAYLVRLYLEMQTTGNELSKGTSITNRITSPEDVTANTAISNLAPELAGHLKGLIKVQDEELNRLREECSSLQLELETIRKHQLIINESEFVDLTKQRDVLIKEVKILREEVNSLILNSSNEQQQWANQRSFYQQRISFMELQLTAVVKAYDQIESQQMVHQTETTTPKKEESNVENLLELLAFLEEKFSNVGDFFKSINFDFEHLKSSDLEKLFPSISTFQQVSSTTNKQPTTDFGINIETSTDVQNSASVPDITQVTNQYERTQEEIGCDTFSNKQEIVSYDSFIAPNEYSAKHPSSLYPMSSTNDSPVLSHHSHKSDNIVSSLNGPKRLPISNELSDSFKMAHQSYDNSAVNGPQLFISSLGDTTYTYVPSSQPHEMSAVKVTDSNFESQNTKQTDLEISTNLPGYLSQELSGEQKISSNLENTPVQSATSLECTSGSASHKVSDESQVSEDISVSLPVYLDEASTDPLFLSDKTTGLPSGSDFQSPNCNHNVSSPFVTAHSLGSELPYVVTNDGEDGIEITKSQPECYNSEKPYDLHESGTNSPLTFDNDLTFHRLIDSQEANRSFEIQNFFSSKKNSSTVTRVITGTANGVSEPADNKIDQNYVGQNPNPQTEKIEYNIHQTHMQPNSCVDSSFVSLQHNIPPEGRDMASVSVNQYSTLQPPREFKSQLSNSSVHESQCAMEYKLNTPSQPQHSTQLEEQSAVAINSFSSNAIHNPYSNGLSQVYNSSNKAFHDTSLLNRTSNVNQPHSVVISSSGFKFNDLQERTFVPQQTLFHSQEQSQLPQYQQASSQHYSATSSRWYHPSSFPSWESQTTTTNITQIYKQYDYNPDE